jgi:hypothetical protein
MPPQYVRETRIIGEWRLPYDSVVRIGLLLVLCHLLLAVACAAACSDPPPTQIPLARLTDEGCTAFPAQPIGRTCLPHLASENVPLAFEVEEKCGTCSSSIETCAVLVSGRDVTLSLDGESCHGKRPCPETCAKRRATCRLPALPAGRYNIRYADAEGRVVHLEVGPGGAHKCALGDSG